LDHPALVLVPQSFSILAHPYLFSGLHHYEACTIHVIMKIDAMAVLWHISTVPRQIGGDDDDADPKNKQKKSTLDRTSARADDDEEEDELNNNYNYKIPAAGPRI
jgi:hypothetical protein